MHLPFHEGFMITKYLIPAILASVQNWGSFESTRQAIRIEALSIIFRSLMGLILSSVIIYSMVQLGDIYQIWLAQFENEFAYKISSFILITIVSVGILHLLFYDRVNRRTMASISPNSTAPSEETQNLKAVLLIIANEFYEGFVEGLEAPEAKDSEPPREKYSSSL